MVTEVMEGLDVAPGKRYIDATAGGGGHAWEIVKRGGTLLGIDTDADALEAAKEEFRIKNLELGRTENWKLVQGNFRDIEHIAKEHGFDAVDGILFDLGVSSHQLDTAGRGFSYRFGDAPLDLRLNQETGETAAAYLQKVSENELYEILATYGEEERARTIAAHIVRARSVSPIETTGQLLTVIEAIVGAGNAKNVASKVFQALRIVVNDELGSLKAGLKGAQALLQTGGRLAVISFHSLEDRIVKQFVRSDAWKVITKKPIVAMGDEIRTNRRARSAKLRIAEKL